MSAPPKLGHCSDVTGPLSQWLYSVLAEVGLLVICVETRHMRAALKAQVNKTDRNDARGIAQMMRAG
jgi:transposase